MVNYVYSAVVIAQQIMLVVVLVAGFLLLLQLIKYFKNRNTALARDNACAEQPQAASACCQPESVEAQPAGEEHADE